MVGQVNENGVGQGGHPVAERRRCRLNCRPARLLLGDPMPDEIGVLPMREDQGAALLHRCSVDAGDTGPPPRKKPARPEIGGE